MSPMLEVARVLVSWRVLSFIRRSAASQLTSRSDQSISLHLSLMSAFRLAGRMMALMSSVVSTCSDSSFTLRMYSSSLMSSDIAASEVLGRKRLPEAYVLRSSFASSLFDVSSRLRPILLLLPASILIRPLSEPLAERSEAPERSVREERLISSLFSFP